MIRLGDAVRLAATKLRTHRVRTAITVLIAALLFAALFAAMLVTTGVFDSIERFSGQGLTSRYIAQAFWVANNSDTQDTAVRTIAKRLYADELAARKAEAKRVGLAESDALVGFTYPIENENTPGGFVYMNMSNPVAQKAYLEYSKQKPRPDLSEIIDKAKAYGATDSYAPTGLMPVNGAATVMKDGKENFTPPAQQSYDYKDQPMFSESIAVMPDTLVQSYLLNGADWRPENGTIPIIIPQFRAEQLLGMAAPGKAASSDEKLQYAQLLREKAAHLTVTACYRSSTSAAQIDAAVQAAADRAKYKNDPSYVQPSLVYGLPDSTACAAAPVTRDIRTAAEKKYELTLRDFNAKFGQPYVPPTQAKLTFQVVGIAPNPPMVSSAEGGLTEISGLISSMVSTQIPSLSIPQNYFDSLPATSPFRAAFGDAATSDAMSKVYGASQMSLLEFPTASSLTRFINNESCNWGADGTCPADKPFVVQSFGSNSAALADAKAKVSRLFAIALLVVVAIAVVILGFTISRAIADSRRETAVFRAIGFKRVDIVAVYVIYTLSLALLVLLVSAALGALGAALVHSAFWVDATVQSRLLFGVTERPIMFSFMSFNSPYLLVVAGAIMAAALLASVVPLVRNARRNPIRDMRDE